MACNIWQTGFDVECEVDCVNCFPRGNYLVASRLSDVHAFQAKAFKFSATKEAVF